MLGERETVGCLSVKPFAELEKRRTLEHIDDTGTTGRPVVSGDSGDGGNITQIQRLALFPACPHLGTGLWV